MGGVYILEPNLGFFGQEETFKTPGQEEGPKTSRTVMYLTKERGPRDMGARGIFTLRGGEGKSRGKGREWEIQQGRGHQILVRGGDLGGIDKKPKTIGGKTSPEKVGVR